MNVRNDGRDLLDLDDRLAIENAIKYGPSIAQTARARDRCINSFYAEIHLGGGRRNYSAIKMQLIEDVCKNKVSLDKLREFMQASYLEPAK